MHKNFLKTFIVICNFLCFPLLCRFTAVPVNLKNLPSLAKQNRLVFINFFAGWCRFSISLDPVFEAASNKFAADFPNASVVFAKANCDVQKALAKQYKIKKYPTLKLFRDGKLAKREYRGDRSVQALIDFLLKQLKGGVEELESRKDLRKLQVKRLTVIGQFSERNSPEHENFKKVAEVLRDDCNFFVRFGDTAHSRAPRNYIVFKSGKKEPELAYNGSLTDHKALRGWTERNCLPLVQEITFENAEGLTEEGLVFLIMFHTKKDTRSLVKYKEAVTGLASFKDTFKFLEADCDTFNHPLTHLDKSSRDCPLLVIDSFKHIYLLPEFEDMSASGKLKQFLLDFNSGKLHREFHGNHLSIVSQLAQSSKNAPKKGKEKLKEFFLLTRESVFKNLRPSQHRYTFKRRDEL